MKYNRCRCKETTAMKENSLLRLTLDTDDGGVPVPGACGCTEPSSRRTT